MFIKLFDECGIDGDKKKLMFLKGASGSLISVCRAITLLCIFIKRTGTEYVPEAGAMLVKMLTHQFSMFSVLLNIKIFGHLNVIYSYNLTKDSMFFIWCLYIGLVYAQISSLQIVPKYRRLQTLCEEMVRVTAFHGYCCIRLWQCNAKEIVIKIQEMEAKVGSWEGNIW